MSTEQQRNNLDLVNKFIGWGDPKSDLWFIALEEGGAFDESYLTELRKRKRDFGSADLLGSKNSGLFWEEPSKINREEIGKRSIAMAESEIGATTIDRNLRYDIEEYRCKKLWGPGGSFHCNIFPIGHQRRSGLPAGTNDLFGVQRYDDEIFVKAYRERWALMRSMIAAIPPKVIVCFGITQVGEFEKCLGLPIADRKLFCLDDNEKYRAFNFKASRVVIVPHPSYANRQKSKFTPIARGLETLFKAWGV